MVIYIDILFLINFFMNIFILWAVSFVFLCKTTLKRLFFAAFLSAFMYCASIMYISFSLKCNLALSLVIESVMVVIAFKPKSTSIFFKNIIFTYVTAIVLGGVSFYVWNLFKGGFFSVKVLAISVLICYGAIKLFIGYADRFFVKRKSYTSVEIFINGSSLDFDALIDTGFSLSNPKIIIVEKSKIPLSGKESVTEIPFKSLGNENGIIFGIKSDFAIINGTKTENVIIGLFDGRLSKGEFNAIISPEIMKE